MVYVLIPAHNNKKEVLELLVCLHRQSYKDIGIVLVDDGSTDNTETEVRERFPDTVILRGDGNLWWTGANVLGVDYILKKAGDDDFILLLNNDLIVEEDYVETLLNASVSQDRAIVGSTLVDHDNPDSIESGIRFDKRLNLLVTRDRNAIENTEFDMNVDALPGRGTLVPIEVFRNIGNFNVKELPHYGADYEFAVRAKRAGYKLIVSHRARVFANLAITGLEVPKKRIITLKECFNLLFSKKSKSNIYYYLNYVWLCSDRTHRGKNTINAAIGILTITVCRTIVVFPFYFLISSLFKIVKAIFRFLFRSYPFRLSDIERLGLNPKDLIEGEVLKEGQFRGETFYFLRTAGVATSGIEDVGNKLAKLRRLSKSYPHKIIILLEALKVLFRRKSLREI